MKAIKRKNTWFAVALCASILGVAAIPGIVLSAINGLYVLMALCIALVADVLYGVPFYWIAFASASRDCKTADAVLKHGYVTVTDVAQYLSCNEEEAEKSLRRCIAKDYLEGMLLRDGKLFAPQRQFLKTDSAFGVVCPYCNTTVKSEFGVCPNCGAPVTQEQK